MMTEKTDRKSVKIEVKDGKPGPSLPDSEEHGAEDGAEAAMEGLTAAETAEAEEANEKDDNMTAPEKNADDAESRISALEKEAKENYEKLLRVSAEFENYKKRSVREMDAFRKFANESIFKSLLPAVDNLERAIASASDKETDGDNGLIEGVKMTLKEMLTVFEKYGVKAIDALGEPFDPAYHEAVMQEASEEAEDNTVVRELQKGYMIHDRLLRPAMVTVAKSEN